MSEQRIWQHEGFWCAIFIFLILGSCTANHYIDTFGPCAETNKGGQAR